MKRLAGLCLLLAPLACTPANTKRLEVGGQFRSAKAEAFKQQDGDWTLRLTLPNPNQSLQWEVLPEDTKEVDLKVVGETTRAEWRITPKRWMDLKPFKVQVRNQNAMDVAMTLQHSPLEGIHQGLVIVLQILGPLIRI